MSGPPPLRSLPRAARILVLAVIALAAAAVTVAQVASASTGRDLAGLAICLPLCVAGSFFEVRAPRGYWLQPHLPVFVAGAALLSPAVMAVLAVATFLPSAVKRHERWYRAAFNIATLMLAGTLAGVVSQAGAETVHPLALVVRLFVASVALVAVNHLLVNAVAALAQGVTPGRAALSAVRMHLTVGAGILFDLALALTGAAIAALWTSYPEALPLAIGPAALTCASLWVPMLRHASRTDAKTGLFNYGHVRHLMGVEIGSAMRSGRPASVLMVDLDHLRLVNNRHGHLVGDALIAAVAAVIGERTGGRGSAGRFGGEEFCAVFPGMDPAQAAVVAEEIRARVTAVRLPVGDTHVGEHSVSIGVAAFPEHGSDVDAVLNAADMALYEAKLGGRNSVCMAPRKASAKTVRAATPTAATRRMPAPVQALPDLLRR